MNNIMFGNKLSESCGDTIFDSEHAVIQRAASALAYVQISPISVLLIKY